MLRKIVLLWALIFTSGLAEDTKIISYYLGKNSAKHDLRESFTHLAQQAELGDQVKINFDPLEKAPFESRFFEEGNTLLDLTGVMTGLQLVKDPGFAAVLNETTGRVVVKASQLDQMFMSMAFEKKYWPVQATLRVKFFSVSRGMGKIIPEDAKLLKDVTLESRPGQSVAFVEPGMRIDWESQVGSDDLVLDSRITMKGLLGEGEAKTNFVVNTGSVFLAGKPLVLELGGIGDDGGTFAMELTCDIVTFDGVLTRELVQPEVADPRSEEMRLQRLFGGIENLEVDEDGKVFKVFNAPPTFGVFIGVVSEDDPFADEPESRLAVIAPNDRRVLILPGETCYDLKEQLTKQGVQFTEGEFAFLTSGGWLYALTTPTQMDLVAAICMSNGGDTPRNVITAVELIQTSKEVTAANLAGIERERVARLVLPGCPGENSKISLGRGEREAKLELEPQVGADNMLLDLRVSLKLTEKKEEVFSLKNGTSVWSGDEVILQKSFRDGKWQTLIIRSEIVPVYSSPEK